MLTPYLIALGGLAVFGGSQQMKFPGKPDQTVWYQNAAFVWIPLMVVGAALAWTMLKSVPIKANIRQQFDIFKNQDTWWMTVLYIMTFGTFSGLSAQFGLLMINLYGAGNAEIVTVTSLDDPGVPGRQRVDTASHCAACRIRGAFVERIAIVEQLHWYGAWLGLDHCIQTGYLRLPCRLATRVGEQVAANLTEPREDCGVPTELRQIAHGIDQGLLHDVL